MNRVERHFIHKKHQLFSYIDTLSYKTKNLYNLANYHMRQVFILWQKENISDDEKTFLIVTNEQIHLYNESRKLRGKNPIAICDAKQRVLKYEFLNFLLKNTEAYSTLPSHVLNKH